MFKESMQWREFSQDDITKQLITFLDLKDFVIITLNGIDTPKFNPQVRIKTQTVEIPVRWFDTIAEAQMYALDFVVDLFEVEQSIAH